MPLLWDKVIRPIAFSMDAERAHELGLKALESGVATPFYSNDVDPILECERFGLKFSSPLGVAAGFDKNGVVVEPLARLGFGFVEVGTVTAKPQPGNPKPRLFRLPDDKALINRLGFNNDGAAVVVERLAKHERSCVIGVNIGRNKDVAIDDAVENYLEAYKAVWTVADYVVVNVSSPNTPGLRDLQRSERLVELLRVLQEKNRALSTAFRRPADQEPPEGGTQSGCKPLLVKVAPDLDDAEIEAIVDVAVRLDISGIIATNTTISPGGVATDPKRFGEGGLSGMPLRELSTKIISSIYKLSMGNLPIIGVGGIFTAEDAFEKMAAGASLVQAYTGFVYGGPGFPQAINEGLAKLLRERGFGSPDGAVGSDAR